MKKIKPLSSRCVKELNQRLVKPKGDALVQLQGKVWASAMVQAAELASAYNATSLHPYDLGDCLLGKVNLLPKKKIRKNPYYKGKFPY